VVAGHLATVSGAGRFAELSSVDIADIIAGRPEEEALEVLRTICSAFASVKNLTSIDVSDNALGAKGLDACAALLEGQSQLVSIKVISQNLPLSLSLH
jgi:Ran GTPase-activating protein 1